MDATEELAPIGTLVATLRDKQALAVPVAKVPYLERTPVDLPYTQTTTFTAKGTLNAQGEFKGHMEQSYHGEVEMIIRAAFRAVPQSQWKELVQQFSNATGFAGEVQTPEVSPVEQLAVPLHFAYDYKREKYGDWDNHRISPPMPPVGWELAPGVKQIKPADDIELGSPGDQDYRASVELPEGWALFLQPNVDLKEDWAEYHATYAFKGSVFSAERRLQIKKDKVPLADWDKYLAFRRALYDDEVRMTPILNSNTLAGANIALDSDAYWRMDAVRTKMGEILPSLKEAVEILTAPAKAEETARAKGICEKLVTDTEAESLQLEAKEARSLYYAQALSAAWTCMGWADLDAGDAAGAETYLRSAWLVGQSWIAGYELGRALEAKGNKAEAAHMYELAHLGAVDNLMGAVLPGEFNAVTKSGEGYKRLTGKAMPASGLNGGAYTGSLRMELDKEEEIRPFTRASKLTGSGLFAVAFEAGKPVKAILLKGDPGFGSMEAALAAHAFLPELPKGSKGRVLREVRLICTPWAGCDAYLLLPTAIELPSDVMRVTPGAVQKTTTVDGKEVKVIQLRKQP